MAAPRIHHLNCGTMCPHAGALLGDGARVVCHVLLIEAASGLVLVDTGIGSGQIAAPKQIGPLRHVLRPQLDPAETAVAQVRALGFDPDDVRHIVATHLDFDHAGGLPDFPKASVHVFAREHASFQKPALTERPRYWGNQFDHAPTFVTHELAGETWMGFDSVRVLPGSEDEIALVPLPGHTRGHSGVVVRRNDDWLLHCGDAYFHHGDIETPRATPIGLRVFQEFTQTQRGLRIRNLQRLRALARERSGEVTLVCAHDQSELAREQSAASRSAAAPA